MNTYITRATEQRCADFQVVRDWVFGQIDNNLPSFAHEIACVLSAPPDRDQDACAKALISDWYDRMSDAIGEQPATAELAKALRAQDEADAREVLDDALNPMYAPL